jgi:hypothetical protein
MSNRAYRVGQVLFVLTNKDTRIYPVQITEEIIKRTVAGESVSYMVRIGKSGKAAHLSEIDGEIYEEIDRLREVLTKRVVNMINGVIDNALLKSSEWYEQPEVLSPIIDQDVQQDEKVVVTLPDGKVANLKISQ